MEQVRARSDGMLALLHRTRARASGLGPILNDRGIDREVVARLFRGDESLKLLQLDEIELFLVQVRSQFGHRRPDEEGGQREKTDHAVELKKQRHHSTTRFAFPPAPQAFFK
jgi:hypothetical protein